MRTRYVCQLANRRLPRSIGRKAANLQPLLKHGFAVPAAAVVGWEAYERHAAGDDHVLNEVMAELGALVDIDSCYAVRSSADVEDDLTSSFAGQFRSVLDVRGAAALRQAIREVWESARSPQVQAYLRQLPPGAAPPRMAVIVQRMVNPAISGVAFSRNPITGAAETIIEAVHGAGDMLVQQGMTPERWIWRDGWLAQGDNVADEPVLHQVVEQTAAIARIVRKPVDLEWVFDGDRIYWVQARPITAVHNLPIYSNTIAREQLPGMIKPLIWSVNIPLVNGAWVRLLTELIGPNDLEPENLAKQFYYRAYYNMGAFGVIFDRLGMPRDALEIMMGVGRSASKKLYMRAHARMLLLAPRAVRFLVHKLRFARDIERFVPWAEAEYRALAALAPDRLNDAELAATIDRLNDITAQLAYYNIVGPLLMHMYTRLFNNRLVVLGVAPEAFELFDDPTILADYDPTPSLTRLRDRLDALAAPARERILAEGYAALVSLPAAAALRADLDEFLARFGHLSASGNDFSATPWRETPDRIIRMAADHRAPAPGAARVRFNDLAQHGPRRALLAFLYRRAQTFRLYRERISSLYTYGYGLFRIFFLELGRRLATRSALAQADDIFYLTQCEARGALLDHADSTLRERAARRKQEMRDLRDITLPEVIYGDEPPAPVTTTSARLRGTPTSSGYYTGRARVVRDLDGCDGIEHGTVLIVSHADVGWAPLFARAGAVVAESGGMLSHSSIIAREYRIPAVVSVPGASGVSDGALVSVDGFKGEVIVHEE